VNNAANHPGNPKITPMDQRVSMSMVATPDIAVPVKMEMRARFDLEATKAMQLGATTAETRMPQPSIH
jgi:hypothetical protein